MTTLNYWIHGINDKKKSPKRGFINGTKFRKERLNKAYFYPLISIHSSVLLGTLNLSVP